MNSSKNLPPHLAEGLTWSTPKISERIKNLNKHLKKRKALNIEK
jgi:hypothetical protein